MTKYVLAALHCYKILLLYQLFSSLFVADHFSGPGGAIDLVMVVCVCLCGQTITFQLIDF